MKIKMTLTSKLYYLHHTKKYLMVKIITSGSQIFSPLALHKTLALTQPRIGKVKFEIVIIKTF